MNGDYTKTGLTDFCQKDLFLYLIVYHVYCLQLEKFFLLTVFL